MREASGIKLKLSRGTPSLLNFFEKNSELILKNKFKKCYKKKKKHWVLKYFKVKKKDKKDKIVLNKKGEDFLNSFLGKIKKKRFSFNKSSILLINKVKPGKRKIPPMEIVVEDILKGKKPFYNYFRILAIPKKEDFLFQKILFNYLNKKFKKIFSPNSYAYKSFSKRSFSRKGTTNALIKVEKLREKYKYATKIDIKRYFDSLDHHILKKIFNKMLNLKEIKIEKEEKKYLNKIIKDYLDSVNRTYEKYCKNYKNKGIFQGHPLSCFLANLYLAPLDNHLEKENFKFFRYADDILILTRDKKDARRAFEISKKFLKKTLKLEVNKKKSIIGEGEFEFLGFYFKNDGSKIIRESTLEKARTKIRKITNFLKRNEKIGKIIIEINQFLGFSLKKGKGKTKKEKAKIKRGYYCGKGWIDYFAEASRDRELEKQMKDLDNFTIRRLISYKYKNTQWNRSLLKKERKNLYKMGLRSFLNTYKIALNRKKNIKI